MSVQDGKCNMCGAIVSDRWLLGCFDAIACSRDCRDALSDLLDGVPLAEVEAELAAKRADGDKPACGTCWGSGFVTSTPFSSDALPCPVCAGTAKKG